MTYEIPKSSGGSVGDHEGLDLTRSIASGSVEKWHQFLYEYSTLVHRVVQRHLPTASCDDVNTVYVDVLKALYDGDLFKFDGRSELSTWLFVYCKRKAIDHWRTRFGRFREPLSVKRLSDFEREVLHLYYIERLGLEVVVHMLCFNGFSVETSDVVNAIQKIESNVDKRFLGRLDEKSRARTNGWSLRYIEYLVHQRVLYEMRATDDAPDAEVIAREARETLDNIREMVDRLPDQERKIIEMRFDQRLQAKEISDRLDLGGPRKVYTIIDKVIRKLRVAV